MPLLWYKYIENVNQQISQELEISILYDIHIIYLSVCACVYVKVVKQQKAHAQQHLKILKTIKYSYIFYSIYIIITFSH